MKKINVVMITGILLLCNHITGYGQNHIQNDKTTVIKPYSLAITLNKTTNLIFPYAILSVDRGSKDVLAQKAKGVENILLVKAAKKQFDQTNLTVITAEGKLYAFLLDYTNNPQVLNISFEKDTTDTAMVFPAGSNEAKVPSIAEKVAKEKRMVYGIKDSKYKMQLRLNGIYIKSDIICFSIEVRNHSNISYDIDMIRFFISNAKKMKRTAAQEIELQPLYVYGDTAVVKGQSKDTLVFALPKFTIADRKYLLIQLMEKQGGRHLQLKVPNRIIIQAKPIQ